MKRVAILGAGAWATALGLTIKRAGHDPILWSRNPLLRQAIEQGLNHPAFSPETSFPPLKSSADISAILEATEAVFLVIPTQQIRNVLKKLPDHAEKIPFILCSKGIEISTGKTPSEIFQEFFPHTPFAILSGPNFAVEIIANLPSATVLASLEDSFLQFSGHLLAHSAFRPYFSRDIIGIEAGGAIKNVLAIAAGIVQGKNLGNNAQAALITRGLVEMTKFGIFRGGDPKTFSGLSGLGDLILSCKSQQSRNMSLGLRLGEADRVKKPIPLPQNDDKAPLSEGVWTAKALYEMQHGLSLPICTTIYDILYQEKNIDEAITELFSRPFTYEHDA